MSVSETVLLIERKNFIFSHEMLGVIGMIFAPALYFGSLFHSPDASDSNQLFASLGGILYLSGAMASATAMKRLGVTGDGAGAFFGVQLVGLLLAMLFDVLEYAAPHLRGTPAFFIADMAYPFSHILMILIGVAVVRAGVWHSWRRIAPFLIGFALPLFFAASAAFGWENSGWVFIGLVTIGFFALGFAVATTKKDEA